MTSLLLNEYEASEKDKQGQSYEFEDFNHYYKKFEAELEIRDIANRYPNSYHIMIVQGYEVPVPAEFKLY